MYLLISTLWNLYKVFNMFVGIAKIKKQLKNLCSSVPPVIIMLFSGYFLTLFSAKK